MAVIVGDSNGMTRFSSLEYQAIMFVLAFVMCVCMALVEVVMKRFTLLPVLFPGVFAIREKRLYFFDIEVKEVSVGKALRWEAVMVIRVTLAVVLSYLWEFCVFQSTTQVGRGFPVDECNQGMDCFASELQMQTFLSRNHRPVNCTLASRNEQYFNEQVVVSCVRFVTPSLSAWLMHLAIAHSMTQLNLKSFGMLVWLCGQSVWFHRVMLATSVTSFVIVCGLTFGGVFVSTSFNSSWSGFVISFSFPLFFWIVWNCANILKELWVQESRQMQEAIEEKLSLALQDLARRSGEESPDEEMVQVGKSEQKRSIFSLQGSIFRMTSLLRPPQPEEKSHGFLQVEPKESAKALDAEQGLRKVQGRTATTSL